MGMILAGTYTLYRTWYEQRAKILSLATDVALLQVPTGELGRMIPDPVLRDKVRLIDSDAPICFCAGFISPRIYLSLGMVAKLTPDELEALLLHEKYHMENNDPLKILLGKIVISALFFIPILRAMFKHYLLEKEVAADQSAIRYQGHSHGIAGALYKMLLETPMVLNPSVAYGGDAIGYRIDYLTKVDSRKKPTIPKLHLAISSLAIAFLIIIILAPLPTHLS
jgi:beta-lactamase regulating signal transducer with metallopeptidase domain